MPQINSRQGKNSGSLVAGQRPGQRLFTRAFACHGLPCCSAATGSQSSFRRLLSLFYDAKFVARCILAFVLGVCPFYNIITVY